MKLLFIAPSAYLLGGVQDWLYLITISLRRRGHNVIVGIPDGIFHKASDYNLYFHGINAITFKNNSGTPEGRIRSLTKFLIKHPSDIIIGVNIGDLYEAYRRYRFQNSNTHLAMTLHAIEADYLDDIKASSSFLDSVITTNKLTQKIVIQKKLIASDRVYYAPYGVATAVPLTNYSQDQKLRIAWVGRIDNEQKRVSDIHKVLTNLDKNNINYVLSIAGDGPYMNQIQNELSYWLSKGQVRTLGFMDKEKLQDIYAQHNILLITSEWETGPIVAWEAMAAGLVVVSSRYIGCSSEGALVDGVTALLYSIGDCERAAIQLSRLCDPEFRNYIATNAKKMVSTRYSADVCVSILEKTFERILERPSNNEYREIQKWSIPPQSSKLEKLLGRDLSEILRAFFFKRGYCCDPGSEWPHSISAQSDQKSLIEYAKRLEENA
jgi:glycosyltransferase involved in cell wall biosynthesis